jgi:hypothetical protein
VSIAGPASASISLTGLFDGTQAEDFEISPDNQWVFFIQQETTSPRAGLYRVRLHPADLSDLSIVRLSDPEVGVGKFFQLSLADRAVIFSGGGGLYRVPFSGHVSRKISHDLPPGWALTDRTWTVTPDGRRVVYDITQVVNTTVSELYSAPTTGPGDAVRLDTHIGISKSVGWQQVSANSANVVYRLSPRDPEIHPDAVKLFSVPIDGPASARVQLNTPVPGLAPEVIFALSPDSSRVLYVLSDPSSTQPLPQVGLYSVPIGGPASASVKLSHSERVFSLPVVDPTSTRVAYIGRSGIREDLYSVPIDGVGQRSRPTADLADGTSIKGSDDLDRIPLTPNGLRAVYATRHLPGPFELYSSPLTVQVIQPGS